MIKKIEEELKILDKYIEIISVAQTYEIDIFTNDPLIYGGAERYALLGMETVFEVCQLIQYLKEWESQTNLVKILEDNKVIPHWLAVNIQRRSQYFSNYKSDYIRALDKEALYYILDDVVSDLRHFRKYVLEFIV